MKTAPFGAPFFWVFASPPGEHEVRQLSERGGGWVGRALGRDTLAGECPPGSACGRPLLLDFAHKGIATHVWRPLAPHSSSAISECGLICQSSHSTRSAVAAGRRLGKIKEGGVAVRRRPGDICRGACRSLRGPYARGRCKRRRHHSQTAELPSETRRTTA
jgi:hypothetical protein